MENAEKEVFALLTDLCGSEVIDTSQSLIGDLSFDSLRMVTLLIMLEDTFGFELDQSDMNPFLLITVNDVLNLVKQYLQKDGAK